MDRSDASKLRRNSSVANLRDRDVELAQQASAGDQQARREVAERLFERVVAMVVRLVGKRGDFDDYIQTSLMEILSSVGTFRGESRLEAWADRITVRTTMRMAKSLRRRATSLVSTSEDLTVLLAPTQDRDVFSTEVWALLHRLPIDRRAAIVLRFAHGYSLSESAKILETSENRIRYNLDAGKKQLRKLLLKKGGRSEWLPS